MNQITNESITYVTFYVGSCKFAIPIIFVKEVQKMLDITPVPRSGLIFQGLANLRGKIVTVVDIIHCFGIEVSADRVQPQLLILKTNQERRALGLVRNKQVEEIAGANDIVALLVDRISETVEINEDTIKAVPVNFDKPFHVLLNGVVDDVDDLLFIINLKALLNKVLDYSDAK